LLKDDGKDVILYGFDESEDKTINQADRLQEALYASPIIIAPLPFTNDQHQLNTPHYSNSIEIEDIFKQMKKDHILLGGHIANEWIDLAQKYEINIIDYFDREELQVLNAIPTAEGVIQLAMEQMDTTIHSSNVMVLGFGRIGKTLANMLAGIGANVYVEARNYADIAWITSYGYEPVLLQDLEANLPEMNLIVNTIPTMILDRSKLAKVNKNTFIIDIASNPGGVDFDEAKKLGIKTRWALGLPGKVAPVTAASCIKKTIYNITNDLEV